MAKDTDDELDVISNTTLERFFSIVPRPPTQTCHGHSLRPRKSCPVQRVTSETKPRKRTLSTTAFEAQKSAAKKIKLDEKKAQTDLTAKKREARDEARKRWLYCHRDVVEPLLPPNSMFFGQLARELEMSNKGSISFKPTHAVDEQPKLIKAGQMKDYQLDGLSFLMAMYKNGMNCILGDEMGLGKTLQTLSLFAYIEENIPGPHDPHLVICPLSVLSSWESEAARWTPSMRVVRFHGPANERDRLKHIYRGGQRNFDIMFTTYDTYFVEDQWFKSFRWTYCVLDEGHKIKNSDAMVAQKVQGLGSLHRLLLTGTPVQNNLLELWGLLHWLLPTVFTTASQSLFRDSFNMERGSYEISFLNAARKLVSEVMLRRTKANVVGDDVPPREELTVFIPLTEAQRFWTYRLLTRLDTPDLEKIFAETGLNKMEDTVSDLDRRAALTHIENQSEGGRANGTQWKKLMNLLMQLRKVCDHPYLLPDAEPEPYEVAEHVVSASSKLVAIDKLLADILPKGERVLIFSQWTLMLDVVEDFMALRSIPYARLDGQTPRPRRALDIKLFQQEKSPYQVFLISTKAGGLGINLTKASTIIMCDSDWNPQNDLQAIARAHRIGQNKVVKVYRLICQGSVEDQMLDRIRRKLFLSVKIMGSDNQPSEYNTSLGSSELMDILRKGSSALSADSGMDLEYFLNANITKILDHSRSLENKRDAMIKKELKTEGDAEVIDEQLVVDAEAEERRLLSGVAQVQSRLFEGKVINKHQPNTDSADEWRNLEKRERVSRTIRVGGMTYLMPYAPKTIAPSAKPVKKAVRKFESEDWCIHCRDGGELVLCQRCPRVFHAKCRGLSKTEMRSPTVTCNQHSCSSCNRSTVDAGGMLFRCRTCPQAFCEDCLPDGELDAVGESLPEFLLLDYGPSNMAYYIRCHDCLADFAENPDSQFWVDWANEFNEVEKALKKRYVPETAEQ